VKKFLFLKATATWQLSERRREGRKEREEGGRGRRTEEGGRRKQLVERIEE